MDRDTNERFSPWTETVVTVVQQFSSMDRDTVYLLIQSEEALEHLNFTDIVTIITTKVSQETYTYTSIVQEHLYELYIQDP